MNRILIVGATGNVGGQVLSQLMVANARIRVLSRNPNAVAFPRQEVIRGDLTLPETLDTCLEGVDTVFLVWVAPPAAVAPALQRIAQHARRIVFLSAPLKTPHPLFQQPNAARVLGERIESKRFPRGARDRRPANVAYPLIQRAIELAPADLSPSVRPTHLVGLPRFRYRHNIKTK